MTGDDTFMDGIPPDPEQEGHDPDLDAYEKRQMLGIIKVLECRLEEIRSSIHGVLHEHESLRREKDTALQALADAVCHPAPVPEGTFIRPWPFKIRMSPKEGLQGWCRGCTAWHPWDEWLRLMGLVKDKDEDYPDPEGWNEGSPI